MEIAVGYDRSDDAKAALKIARQHAKAFKGRVHILTSLPQSTNLKLDDIEKVEKELESLKSFFAVDDISSETHVLVSSSSPGEDLVQYANEHNIDELIIVIRRKSKVDKLIFGSNAQYVILQAECPVLAVK